MATLEPKSKEDRGGKIITQLPSSCWRNTCQSPPVTGGKAWWVRGNQMCSRNQLNWAGPCSRERKTKKTPPLTFLQAVTAPTEILEKYFCLNTRTYFTPLVELPRMLPTQPSVVLSPRALTTGLKRQVIQGTMVYLAVILLTHRRVN